MGFLDFLQASPLKKLEAAAEENPSPETLSALAEKHMELGEFDQALLVADRGLQTFRNATRLREIVQFVRKKQSQARLKPLRDELRVRPSPLAYSQLAGVYREMGDIEQALETLTECAAKYPDDRTASRMVGQIRLENFLQEAIAHDGMHALAALRHVQSLDGADSQARMNLAQLYYAIGANALAVAEMRAELGANPTALDIKKFLDDVGEPPPLGEGVTVESLIERCEEFGSLTNTLQGFPRAKPGIVQRSATPPKVNPAAVQAKVREAAGTPGLLNLAILDREGAPVASLAEKDGLDNGVFLDLAGGIQAVAHEASRRMDIGSLVRGSVAMAMGKGGISFVRRRGYSFAMYHREPMKADRAAVFLEDFCSKVVGGSHGA